MPLEVSLEQNASADPAGDVVVVRAILLPGETALAVEVRGWIGPLDETVRLAPLLDRKPNAAPLVITGQAAWRSSGWWSPMGGWPPAERRPPLTKTAGEFDYPLWAIVSP